MPFPLVRHIMMLPLVVLAAAVITLVAIANPDWWEPAEPGLLLLRALNPYLAVIAVTLVTTRVTEAWATRALRDRAGNTIFAGYIVAAALGSVQAAVLDSPVGPVTALLTALHASTILLMAVWPRLDPTAAAPVTPGVARV